MLSSAQSSVNRVGDSVSDFSWESPVTHHPQPLAALDKPPCSTVMLNLEQTCNNPHLHSLARTVIRAKLSAWACQPFCCQRTFVPRLSECPECLRTRLAGLTGSLCANLPSSSAPVSGIL